jgi:hypothetical protein
VKGPEGTSTARSSLRCLLGFHAWELVHNATGERYDVCSRCGDVGPGMPTGLGWSA